LATARGRGHLLANRKPFKECYVLTDKCTELDFRAMWTTLRVSEDLLGARRTMERVLVVAAVALLVRMADLRAVRREPSVERTWNYIGLPI
jgi:hypothetical protein